MSARRCQPAGRWRSVDRGRGLSRRREPGPLVAEARRIAGSSAVRRSWPDAPSSAPRGRPAARSTDRSRSRARSSAPPTPPHGRCRWQTSPTPRCAARRRPGPPAATRSRSATSAVHHRGRRTSAARIATRCPTPVRRRAPSGPGTPPADLHAPVTRGASSAAVARSRCRVGSPGAHSAGRTASAPERSVDRSAPSQLSPGPLRLVSVYLKFTPCTGDSGVSRISRVRGATWTWRLERVMLRTVGWWVPVGSAWWVSMRTAEVVTDVDDGVVEGDVLDQAAAVGVGLDAEGVVDGGTGDVEVAGVDVADAAGGFAADGEGAVAGAEAAGLDDDVLRTGGRPGDRPRRGRT